MNPLMRVCLATLLLTAACQPPPHQPERQPGLVTDSAMVVTAHPLATQVGVDILRQGGQAIDAAVAVQFALAVVFPVAGNLGGGGFLVARQANGQAYALDFRETAPAAAHRDLYLDSTGAVKSDLSLKGHLAVGVPGSVAGMFAAHDSLGSLPMATLIQPAIDLAAQGFALTELEAAQLNAKLARFREVNTQPSLFTQTDSFRTGDTLRLPELAATLARIRDEGQAGFYAGETAELLEAEMARGGGIITEDDLLAYEAIWREPLRGSYRGHGILAMPPPSSGGVALLQLLGMVEPYPLGEYGWHSPQAVHLITEAERRVYADRATHLGDTDFYPVPIDGLLDPAYLQARMASFDPGQASDSDHIAAGQPAPAESPQTTHFSIVDPQGNAVAITTTLNTGFGSGVWVAGAGFFLNNEMDDFSAKPGVPNFYGLIGAEANAIAPGKRMLSSMTPTIVTRGDSLYLVVGTPGGSTIITSVFQNLVNVIDYGLDMQTSVAAPRYHHQWKPDLIQFEAGAFLPATREQLEQWGHELKPRSSIGRVDAIRVLPGGRLEGGADPRGDDAAGGF